MEAEPNKIERDAPMGLDKYLSNLFDFDQVDGKVPVSDIHSFYIWLSREPEFKDIDGYSLVELFEANVIDGYMDTERFFQWCKDFNFPYPIDEEGKVTPEGLSFNINFYNKEVAQRVEKYEAWAKSNGIDCSEGAVMRFVDAEGNTYRVRTDADNRGEIIT